MARDAATRCVLVQPRCTTDAVADTGGTDLEAVDPSSNATLPLDAKLTLRKGVDESTEAARFSLWQQALERHGSDVLLQSAPPGVVDAIWRTAANKEAAELARIPLPAKLLRSAAHKDNKPGLESCGDLGGGSWRPGCPVVLCATEDDDGAELAAAPRRPLPQMGGNGLVDCRLRGDGEQGSRTRPQSAVVTGSPWPHSSWKSVTGVSRSSTKNSIIDEEDLSWPHIVGVAEPPPMCKKASRWRPYSGKAASVTALPSAADLLASTAPPDWLDDKIKWCPELSGLKSSFPSLPALRFCGNGPSGEACSRQQGVGPAPLQEQVKAQQQELLLQQAFGKGAPPKAAARSGEEVLSPTTKRVVEDRRLLSSPTRRRSRSQAQADAIRSSAAVAQQQQQNRESLLTVRSRVRSARGDRPYY
eukprot:TRINITY_DN15331_c0_g1_i2.p1 TRINITY_DN15331_c0_g1~~TRINITY_DN15331_c0_g1_i2.p1  ORF type:complete len:446 (+),score=86.46 TRINITY_DN15331_c0_g1_i2:88-1338(+)